MTDPEERTINRAIVLLGDEHQDIREEARAALHTIFRRTRKLEEDGWRWCNERDEALARIAELEDELREEQDARRRWQQADVEHQRRIAELEVAYEQASALCSELDALGVQHAGELAAAHEENARLREELAKYGEPAKG